MNIFLLAVIGLVFGIFASHTFELSLKKNKILNRRFYRRHAIIFGYHIHHSTYGLACIAAALILWRYDHFELPIFCVAAGIGIIIMHTLFDGRFIFVEKEK